MRFDASSSVHCLKTHCSTTSFSPSESWPRAGAWCSKVAPAPTIDPRRNPIFLQTLSHKALRLLTPLALATALAANLALARSSPYHLVLAAQLAFYLAAVTGHVLRCHGRRATVFALPYVVCLLSWA